MGDRCCIDAGVLGKSFQYVDNLAKQVECNGACTLPGCSFCFDVFIPIMQRAARRGFVLPERAAFVYEGLRYGFRCGVDVTKMSLDDFRLVVDVHLMGAAICTKAVWETMRAQRYGRIVMTTSSSGLYGNFGQANYGAAKMALVGLMQTLAIETLETSNRTRSQSPKTAQLRTMRRGYRAKKVNEVWMTDRI